MNLRILSFFVAVFVMGSCLNNQRCGFWVGLEFLIELLLVLGKIDCSSNSAVERRLLHCCGDH